MNLKDTEGTLNDKSEKEVTLDYVYINSQVGEAVEHLQDVLNKIQLGSLDSSWLRIRLWDSIRHLSRAYNLRYPENHAQINVEDASKLPWEIVEELGYSGKFINEFVYRPKKTKK